LLDDLLVLGMQRRTGSAKARPDIPTGRLDREIHERREDVLQLQEQIAKIDGKFESLETQVTQAPNTAETQRVLAAVTQSCEACQKGLEQESRIREQALAELSATISASMLQATSALQSEVASMVTELQEVKHAQSQLNKAAHRRDENMGSFKEVIQQAQTSLQTEVAAMVADVRKVKYAQAALSKEVKGAPKEGPNSNRGREEFLSFKEFMEQEVDALKKRAGNQWEHFDAMFAQLNETTAAANKTLTDHDAAIEDIGKVLDVVNDKFEEFNAKQIAECDEELKRIRTDLDAETQSRQEGFARASIELHEALEPITLSIDRLIQDAAPSIHSSPHASLQNTPRVNEQRSPKESPKPHGSAARSAMSNEGCQAEPRGSATPPWSDFDGYDTATETVVSHNQELPCRELPLSYGRERQYPSNIQWSDTASSLPAVDEMSVVLEECLNAGRSWLK
jgi:uncharacterized coiled-coil protein SlyX